MTDSNESGGPRQTRTVSLPLRTDQVQNVNLHPVFLRIHIGIIVFRGVGVVLSQIQVILLYERKPSSVPDGGRTARLPLGIASSIAAFDPPPKRTVGAICLAAIGGFERLMTIVFECSTILVL